MFRSTSPSWNEASGPRDATGRTQRALLVERHRRRDHLASLGVYGFPHTHRQLVPWAGAIIRDKARMAGKSDGATKPVAPLNDSFHALEAKSGRSPSGPKRAGRKCALVAVAQARFAFAWKRTFLLISSLSTHCHCLR